MDIQQQEIPELDLDYAIGDRVNTLMHRSGYTRKAFGAFLGIGQSAMSLKLYGKRVWSATEVKLAADRLGVSVAVLYGEAPMPEPTKSARVTDIDDPNNGRRIISPMFQPTADFVGDVLEFKRPVPTALPPQKITSVITFPSQQVAAL